MLGAEEALAHGHRAAQERLRLRGAGLLAAQRAQVEQAARRVQVILAEARAALGERSLEQRLRAGCKEPRWRSTSPIVSRSAARTSGRS